MHDSQRQSWCSRILTFQSLVSKICFTLSTFFKAPREEQRKSRSSEQCISMAKQQASKSNKQTAHNNSTISQSLFQMGQFYNHSDHLNHHSAAAAANAAAALAAAALIRSDNSNSALNAAVAATAAGISMWGDNNPSQRSSAAYYTPSTGGGHHSLHAHHHHHHQGPDVIPDVMWGVRNTTASLPQTNSQPRYVQVTIEHLFLSKLL